MVSGSLHEENLGRVTRLWSHSERRVAVAADMHGDGPLVEDLPRERVSVVVVAADSVVAGSVSRVIADLVTVAAMLNCLCLVGMKLRFCTRPQHQVFLATRRCLGCDHSRRSLRFAESGKWVHGSWWCLWWKLAMRGQTRLDFRLRQWNAAPNHSVLLSWRM